jgi:hypothetical protein
MMQTNYQAAFSVQVLHTYFEQQVCRCLQFTPSPDTDKMMKKFDCRVRYKVNGFDLYINSKQSLGNALNYIKQVQDQTFFEFTIATNDPDFISFTDLPVDWIGTIMYDSVDVRNTQEGNIVQLNAQLINNDAPSSLGNLKIQFDDIVSKQNYPRFSINFNARSTQWQYFIINKNDVAFDTPAIAKSEFNFSAAAQVIIDNGEQAMLFSSGENLIPLSEIPKYKFDLINNSSNTRSPKILFKGLPNPDVKRIGIVNVKGQKQFSSPMYIYL